MSSILLIVERADKENDRKEQAKGLLTGKILLAGLINNLLAPALCFGTALQ